MRKLLTLIVIACISQSGFSQGYRLEFKLTSESGNMSGEMETYFKEGNSRTEINAEIPGFGNMNVVSLVKKDNPNAVYMLNEKSKTYTEINMESDESWKDYPQEEYNVTVLGKEKVNGFNATHVRINQKGRSNAEEMWLSTDLEGYKEYMKIKTKYTGKDNMNKALAAKGVSGFPVRIKTQDNNQSFQIDLIKAEKKDLSNDLFALKGYTKSEGSFTMPSGVDANEMLKNMQNMTPEELQKMAEELKKQYQPE